MRASANASETCVARRHWAAWVRRLRLVLALAFFVGALGGGFERRGEGEGEGEGDAEVEVALGLGETSESLTGPQTPARSTRSMTVGAVWPPRRIARVRPPRCAPTPKAAPVLRSRAGPRRTPPDEDEDEDDDDAMA